MQRFTSVALAKPFRMSYTNAFPILYLNLGGELVYIIEQRLQAQNVAADKAKKGKINKVKLSYWLP